MNKLILLQQSSVITTRMVFSLLIFVIAVGAFAISIILFENVAFATSSHNSNENLFVSAENPTFENHFAGSMIIEVMVAEPALRDTTDGSAGEPEVSVNGATLRMAQARDGYWYGYFANLKAAQNADQISNDFSMPSRGLDFGVFCASSTPESVLGVSFSDSDGVAVPSSDGLDVFSNGKEPLSSCKGELSLTSQKINNVLRSPPSLNSNSDLTAGGGQIGLYSGAWPVIQLFSFSGDVRVQYERGGSSTQQVNLRYSDIPSISFTTDRVGESYPARAEVILYINDMQLNQDPTDEDSWTFGISPGNPLVFYQAFYHNTGSTIENNAQINLYPHLNRLGFDDNGYLEIKLGDVIKLRPNKNQPVNSISSDAKYADIVTLVEKGSNSGIFESVDSSSISNLYISPDAPRGTSAVITYNDRSLSVLTGSHTASFSLDDSDSTNLNIATTPIFDIDTTGWRSGVRIPILLQDYDQNVRPHMRDNLDVFRHDAVIPSIRIGTPLTVSAISSVMFYPNSGSFDGESVSIPIQSFDRVSARLHLDVNNARLDSNVSYKMVAIDMGFSASQLYDLLISDSISSNTGTNWLNIDLRSFDIGLGADSLADASLRLYFGSLSSDANSIVIADRLGSAQNLFLIKSDAIESIADASGNVYVVIDFGDDSESGILYTKSSTTSLFSPETNSQQYYPIVLDMFSFGIKSGDVVNNAMYRLELEETSSDSGIFKGTLEFAVANQLNIDDPDFIRELSTISNNVKFITLDSMVRDNGIVISYNDLAKVGSIIPQSASFSDTPIQTQSGTALISTPSGQLRFGTPITVTLVDSDLNTSADTVEIYRAVDDPRLPSVDTVGSGNNVLLEIKFKDIRYKRCIINDAEHGGLASTGFSLIETGPATGVFKGIFKMPTWICDKSGSKLISTAGGSMDVVYYDARDSSGESNKFSLLRSLQNTKESASVTGHTGSISDSDQINNENIISNEIETNTKNTDTDNVLTPPQLNQKPFAKLNTERIILQSVGDTQSVVLSGNVGLSIIPGSIVSIIVMSPSGDVQTFDLRTSAAGMYGSKLNFKGGVDVQGMYKINVTQGGDVHIDTVEFYIESTPLVISEQIKHAALEWSNGIIPDIEFVAVLQMLVATDIVTYNDIVENTPVMNSNTSNVVQNVYIPAWLEHAMKWWSMGLLSDADAIQLIQYLLDAKILNLEIASNNT